MAPARGGGFRPRPRPRSAPVPGASAIGRHRSVAGSYAAPSTKDVKCSWRPSEVNASTDSPWLGHVVAVAAHDDELVSGPHRGRVDPSLERGRRHRPPPRGVGDRGRRGRGRRRRWHGRRGMFVGGATALPRRAARARQTSHGEDRRHPAHVATTPRRGSGFQGRKAVRPTRILPPASSRTAVADAATGCREFPILGMPHSGSGSLRHLLRAWTSHPDASPRRLTSTASSRWSSSWRPDEVETPGTAACRNGSAHRSRTRRGRPARRSRRRRNAQIAAGVLAVAGDGSLASHRSAAYLWGLEISRTGPVDVTTSDRNRRVALP